MRRWSRLGAVCIAAGMALAVAGCGQLFQVKGSTSQPTLAELTQRVDQLEAQVSELNAAVAGMGQGRGRAATSSAASVGGEGQAASGAPQAIVAASYLNVHPQPDISSPRVGVLKHDTVVSVLASQGNWTEIGFKSLRGWVESQWLSKLAPAPANSAADASGASSAAPAAGAAVAPGVPSSSAPAGASTNAPSGSWSGAPAGASTNAPSGSWSGAPAGSSNGAAGG